MGGPAAARRQRRRRTPVALHHRHPRGGDADVESQPRPGDARGDRRRPQAVHWVARAGRPRTVTMSTSTPEGRRQFEGEALAHRGALYAFALKLARSRDDAEDLVSDTLLRAFERWEQYRLGTNVRAWLFTILYRVFVSRKRRIDAREVSAPDDSDGRSLLDSVGDGDPEKRFYDS